MCSAFEPGEYGLLGGSAECTGLVQVERGEVG